MDHPIVCQAIQTRRRLAFDYEGFHRVVEPYCHGRGRLDQELLRAVQVGGGSRSGRSLGTGKLWLVAKMAGLRLLPEEFAPGDPNYRPDDQAMASICCRI